MHRTLKLENYLLMYLFLLFKYRPTKVSTSSSLPPTKISKLISKF